jgi:hypothetical protein
MNFFLGFGFRIFYIVTMFRFIKPILRPALNKKYLITNSNGMAYSENNALVFMNSNKFFKDKKLVSISPAGYYGFYVTGICTYIKENYDTSNFIFSGASAGAWNALYMTLKTDPKFMTRILINNELYENKTIFQIEREMKRNIMSYYSTRDFDLDRLFIGVTTIGQTLIYTDFDNLEDAIDCCIASSHIPFITGALVHRYKDIYTFDGGFSEYPYLPANQTDLHITPNIWGQNKKMKYNMFNRNAFDLQYLFDCGYRDTVFYGKGKLDSVFLPAPP